MWNLKLCQFAIVFSFVIFCISTINSSPVIVYHSSGKQPPSKSQAIIVSNGNDDFKGDKILKDNEVGYFTKSNERGDDGYERFESFHDKDADSYGYEKHEAYGKTAIGENQNGKTDGKTGHSYQVIEHQDEPVGLAGNKYKNDDGALSKGYSFSINSHYDDDDSNGDDYGGDHYNSKYIKNDGNDDGEYYENDDDDDDDDDDDSDDNGGGHTAAGNGGHAIEMLHSINDEKVIAAGKTGGAYKKLDDYKDYDYHVQVKHVDPVIEAKQQRNDNYKQNADYSNESIKSDDNNSDDVIDVDDNKLVDGRHNNVGYNSYETYIVHPEISKESGAEESSKSYEKYQIEIKDNIKPTIIATKEIIHENVKSTKKPYVKKNNNNNYSINKKNSNPKLHTKIIENYDDVEDIDTGNYNNNNHNSNLNNNNNNNNHYYDDDDDDDGSDERHSNYEYDNDYHHEQPKSIGDGGGGGGGGSSAHYRNDNKDDYGYGNHYVYASEADVDAILK